MDLKLQNKTAFISGSTKGIGFAIASRLRSEGAHVIVNGRSQSSVDEALIRLEKVESSGKLSGFTADFADAGSVKELIAQLPDLDILVNNVGIFQPAAFSEIPDADWLRFFEVNVLSGVRLSRHFFPKMLEKDWGRILFISSESAVFIPDEMIHYGMTKTAQLAVARGLSELAKGSGVTVNSILPGPTRSEGVEQFIKDLAESNAISEAEAEKNFFRDNRPTSLLQRFATVEEVADTVAYYCSPLASATNGAPIRVEGGLIKSVL